MGTDLRPYLVHNSLYRQTSTLPIFDIRRRPTQIKWNVASIKAWSREGDGRQRFVEPSNLTDPDVKLFEQIDTIHQKSREGLPSNHFLLRDRLYHQSDDSLVYIGHGILSTSLQDSANAQATPTFCLDSAIEVSPTSSIGLTSCQMNGL